MLIVLFLFNQIVEIHRFFSLNGLFLNTKKCRKLKFLTKYDIQDLILVIILLQFF